MMLLLGRHGRRGVTAAEYAVLGAAVAVIVAAAVVVLGDPVNGAFARLANVITDAVNELINTNAGLGTGQGSAWTIPPGEVALPFASAADWTIPTRRGLPA